MLVFLAIQFPNNFLLNHIKYKIQASPRKGLTRLNQFLVNMKKDKSRVRRSPENNDRDMAAKSIDGELSSIELLLCRAWGKQQKTFEPV